MCMFRMKSSKNDSSKKYSKALCENEVFDLFKKYKKIGDIVRDEKQIFYSKNKKRSIKF